MGCHSQEKCWFVAEICLIWKLMEYRNRTKYSRMNQVKICRRQPLKNLKGYDLLKQIPIF